MNLDVGAGDKAVSKITFEVVSSGDGKENKGIGSIPEELPG